MKSLEKNSSGFTLVELMVVVAIIGILSAIAVPNFKKYQGKSKQSEAKIQLAAVYSTEVAANADYDTFATCIINIGYDGSPKGYYLVGFSAHDATTAAQVDARAGVGTCGTSSASFAPRPGAPNHLKANAAATLPTEANLPAGTAVTSATFTAGATGNIASAQTTYDQWTVNQTKAMTNVGGGVYY